MRNAYYVKYKTCQTVDGATVPASAGPSDTASGPLDRTRIVSSRVLRTLGQPRMAHILAAHEIKHELAQVLAAVADAFKRTCAPQAVEFDLDMLRRVPHALDQGKLQMAVRRIEAAVAVQHVECEVLVQACERVEERFTSSTRRRARRRRVCEAAQMRAGFRMVVQPAGSAGIRAR